MNRKSLFLVIAFFLFIYGFLSLVLGILGLQFTFLMFLDQLPGVLPYVIKAMMMFTGIVMAYLLSTNWRRVD